MLGIHRFDSAIAVTDAGEVCVIRFPSCQYRYDSGRICGRRAVYQDPFWPYEIEQCRCSAHAETGGDHA